MAHNPRVLITGGAGFIGSCFVRTISGMERYSRIVNVDKLTYAGNLENVQAAATDPRYVFVRADITDEGAIVFNAADHYTGKVELHGTLMGYPIDQTIMVEGKRYAACTSPQD